MDAISFGCLEPYLYIYYMASNSLLKIAIRREIALTMEMDSSFILMDLKGLEFITIRPFNL